MLSINDDASLTTAGGVSAETLQKLAQFYEQCTSKGYTDMSDETQSLKAKVIAKDLGLDYRKIGDLYKKAEKAPEQLRAVLEERQETARRLAVKGELLLEFEEDPDSSLTWKLSVYRRPDGSIYTLVNGSTRHEGYPELRIQKSSWTEYNLEEGSTTYVGTTVGNTTVVNGVSSGGGVRTKEHKTDNGYFEAVFYGKVYGIKKVTASPFICERFKRDGEFTGRFRSGVLKLYDRSTAQARQADEQYKSAVNWGKSSTLTLTLSTKAKDAQRLPYSECQRIRKLLDRILEGEYPPSDEELYSQANALAKSGSDDAQKKAYEIFSELGGYKDSKAMADSLRSRYEDIVQLEKEADILRDEKRRKNTRRALIIGIPLAILAIFLIFSAVRSARVKKANERMEYITANQCLLGGQYSNCQKRHHQQKDVYDMSTRQFKDVYVDHYTRISFTESSVTVRSEDKRSDGKGGTWNKTEHIYPYHLEVRDDAQVYVVIGGKAYLIGEIKNDKVQTLTCEGIVYER